MSQLKEENSHFSKLVGVLLLDKNLLKKVLKKVLMPAKHHKYVL
jgi:hypothetical protein